MDQSFLEHLDRKLDALREQGLYKAERVIVTQQAAEIAVASGEEVLRVENMQKYYPRHLHEGF